MELTEKHKEAIEELLFYCRSISSSRRKRKLWSLFRKYFRGWIRDYYMGVPYTIGGKIYKDFSEEEEKEYKKMLREVFDGFYVKYPFKRGRPFKVVDFKKVFDLREQGYSIRGIAKELGISKSKVERALKFRRV